MNAFLKPRSRSLSGLTAVRSQLGACPTRSSTIDVWDAAVLREWCSRLNTTPERLIAAVIVMGDQLRDVQRHLDAVKS
jgi:hypothetical protein